MSVAEWACLAAFAVSIPALIGCAVAATREGARAAVAHTELPPSADWPCLTLSPDTTKVCTADTTHDADHVAHGPGGEVTATWPRSATDRTAMEHDAMTTERVTA